MSDRFGNIPIDSPKQTTASRLKAAKKRITQSTAAKPPEKIPGKSKRGPTGIWTGLVIFVLCFALYSCLGFLGVPYYLSDMFPASFHKKTGLELVPGEIKFNPLTFRFEAADIKVVNSTGTVLVSLKSLVTELAPLSLLRLDMVCNSLSFDELDLNLTREKDGSYDFQGLLGEKEVNNPKAIMNFSDLPFFFSLNNIAINNSSIFFKDIPAQKNHKVEHIQLSLPTFSNISFQADNYLKPRFSAVINGSPIELTGQAYMGGQGEDSQATKLSCDIKDLDLPLYASYIPFDLPFQFIKGKAEGKLELSFDPEAEEGHKFAIGFDANINRLELAREDGSMNLMSEAARLTGELLPVSKQVHLEHIALRSPVVHSYGKSLGSNFSNLISTKESATENPALPLSPPLEVVADLFIIDNGNLRHFTGRKDKKPQREYHSLQLAIEGYSSKQTKKRDNGNGTFRINGEISNSPAQFSFQGTFPTPSSLAGTLSIVKAQAGDLLSGIGDKHPFSIQGKADLKGQLHFVVSAEGETKFGYSLSDTELSILDFRFIENKETLIEAPLVKIGSLSFQNTPENKIHFGKVSIENGIGSFQYNKIPDSFSVFGTSSYQIEEIDYSGSLKFNWIDKKGGPLIFNGFTMSAGELTAPEADDNFSYSGETGSGGTIQGKGTVQLDPFGLTTTTNFKNLATSEIFPFFTSHPLLHKLSGELSGEGRLILPKPQFTGELQLFEGAIKDDRGKQYSWQRAIFQEVQYSINPSELKLSSLTVEAPEFVWTMNTTYVDPIQEIAEYIKSVLPKVSEPKDDKKSSQYFPLEIGELSINDARIQLEDLRLAPNWTSEVTDLIGKIADINSTSTEKTADFEFTGKLDDTPFSYSGDVGLFSGKKTGRTQFSLGDYPLASFHEQLTAKLDVDTSEGEFSLVDESEWKDGQQVSSAKFTFSNVSPVSSSSESAIPLALLIRSDETFDLTVERSGRDFAAGRGLFDLTVGRFQTLVVKGSVSPFLLTGDTFSDLIGSDTINFKPGEIILTKEGQKLLGRYVDLLNNHPHIGLHLSGGIGPQLDKTAIREKMQLVERIRVDSENEKLFEEWQRQKALLEEKLQDKRKAAEESGEIVEMDLSKTDMEEFVPLSPEPIVIDDAMVLDLGEKRLNIFYTHLSARLPSAENRISLAPIRTMDDVNTASSPGITVSLKAFEK